MTSVKKISLGAAVLASAAGLAFAGTAQAATAAVPTADYQFCGNVVDSSGNGISGALVRGWLSSAPSTYYNALSATDSEGRYCVQGTAAMSTAILLGGTAYASVYSKPSPYTTSSPATWGPINTATFLAHKVSGYQSANGFDFVLS